MECRWRNASLDVVNGTLVSHGAPDWISQEAPRSGRVLVEVDPRRPGDERIVFISDDVEVHIAGWPCADVASSLFWTEPLERLVQADEDKLRDELITYDECEFHSLGFALWGLLDLLRKEARRRPELVGTKAQPQKGRPLGPPQ